MEHWITIIVSLVVGIGAGSVSTLIKLHFDKKQDSLKHKRELVDSWRAMLAELRSSNQENEVTHLKENITKTKEFFSLKPHLSKDFLSVLHSTDIIIITDDGTNIPYLENELIDEISRIEKEWKLI